METLFELLMPLTLLLTIILASHHALLKVLGAVTTYKLWLIVPIGLLAYSVPVAWQQSDVVLTEAISQYLVTPTKKVSAGLSINWLFIWPMISGIFLAYWLISHLQFSKGLNLTPDDESSLLMAKQTQLPKSLPVCMSESAYSPMLIGLIKQKLVLPKDFYHLYNDEQQALIIEHEICHFDRNDIYWNLIAASFIALFWFHPLVWLAYFRFRRDQELSCDAIVLARKQFASRVNYSKALLVAAETAPPLAFAQLSFKKYGDKAIMFERIKQVKLNTKGSTFSLLVASLVSVSLLSGLSYAGNVSSLNGEVVKKKRTPPKVQEQAKPVYRVEPKYPIKAATEKIEGAVVLKFDIQTDGSVSNVEVMKGVPAYVFDRVAVAALEQWKYDSKGEVHKNQLVQLDFRMDKDSTFKDVNLIEKIKVTQ